MIHAVETSPNFARDSPVRLGGVMVKALDLTIVRSPVQLPAAAPHLSASLDKSLAV